MKRLLLLFLITLSFTGCTTVEFVRKDLTPEKKAVIRYPPQSSEEGTAKHRAELDQKATSFCGGNYTIIKEYEALEETGRSTGVSTGFGMGMGRGMGSAIFVGGASPRQEMFHFVELVCENQP